MKVRELKSSFIDIKATLHVNRHIIARNVKDGGHRPVYSIDADGRKTYAHGVVITGRTELIDPRNVKPLPCGATAYMRVDGDITLVDPCRFGDIAT